MQRYTSKHIRGAWSEESLLKAIERVQQGKSLRQAAVEYGIPGSTLVRRLKTPAKGKFTLGGKPILGEMEHELVTHLLEMERSLFGITAIDLRKLTFQVV